jgi:hypothetical protein
MKIFLILVITFLASLSMASIQPSMLHFEYRSTDGNEKLACVHQIQNAAAQDWLVTCGNKKYSVHLWVSAYIHEKAPKLSYEVLYWVSDLSVQGQPHGSSTTVWFHLQDPSYLSLLQVSLGVENDSAQLHLDLDPSKK